MQEKDNRILIKLGLHFGRVNKENNSRAITIFSGAFSCLLTVFLSGLKLYYYILFSDLKKSVAVNKFNYIHYVLFLVSHSIIFQLCQFREASVSPYFVFVSLFRAPCCCRPLHKEALLIVLSDCDVAQHWLITIYRGASALIEVFFK